MEFSCKVITGASRAEEVLLAEPASFWVFERLGLPLLVGDHTLAELAAARGCRVHFIISLLQLNLGRTLAEITPLQVEDIPFLLDYLLVGHDYYIGEATPNIAGLLGTILPDVDPSIRELLRKFFDRYMEEARVHFDYERDTVFPYIRSLWEARNLSEYRVQEYKHHHSDIQVKLSDLQNLFLRYLPPLHDDGQARRLLYALGMLREDLKIHTLLEDEVLVPLVERMERRWKQ